jgi:hypothetical protein
VQTGRSVPAWPQACAQPLQDLLGPESALLRKYQMHRSRARDACSAAGPADVPEATAAATERDEPAMPSVHTAALRLARNSMQLQCSAAHASSPQAAGACEGPHAGPGKRPDSMPTAGVHDDQSAAPEGVTRRITKVDKLMEEWGFQERATAEAYLQSQRHTLHARKQRVRRAKLADPSARLHVRPVRCIQCSVCMCVFCVCSWLSACFHRCIPVPQNNPLLYCKPCTERAHDASALL